MFAITQGASAGWTSTQTLSFALAGIVGLAVFAVLDADREAPSRRPWADIVPSAAGLVMVAAAGSIFGLFFLCSVYLQNVLGSSPLMTRAAFIPLALAAGAGAHLSGHLIARHGVRTPLAGAFGVSAVGMALLSQVSADGSYLRDVLPGMLVAGLGLGVAVVTVSVAILTGARENEAGMLSGLNSTGHEIGKHHRNRRLLDYRRPEDQRHRRAWRRHRHRLCLHRRGRRDRPRRRHRTPSPSRTRDTSSPSFASTRAQCRSTDMPNPSTADTPQPAREAALRRRPQRQRRPRGGPRGTGGRSRCQHGRDRPSRGRRPRHDLRPLPDPRVAPRRGDGAHGERRGPGNERAEPERGEPKEAMERMIRTLPWKGAQPVPHHPRRSTRAACPPRSSTGVTCR